MTAPDPSLHALVPGLADALAQAARPGRMLLAGMCGAQGSGKSTLSGLLEASLSERGLRPLTLALDDFYLTKAERNALAREVHPLCETRGVPGTHDAALMARTIDALAQAGEGTRTHLPVFSKLDDDRAPESTWRSFEGRPDVVILEGWCIGAEAEPEAAWSGPINALEEEADPDGIWWRWWNACLARDYAPIWQRLDKLILIRVPDIETVVASRLLQEERLAAERARKGEVGGPPPMTRAQVERFVAHYERLTRRIWAEMPARADFVIERDAQFHFRVIKPRQRETT